MRHDGMLAIVRIVAEEFVLVLVPLDGIEIAGAVDLPVALELCGLAQFSLLRHLHADSYVMNSWEEHKQTARLEYTSSMTVLQFPLNIAYSIYHLKKYCLVP